MLAQQSLQKHVRPFLAVTPAVIAAVIAGGNGTLTITSTAAHGDTLTASGGKA